MLPSPRVAPHFRDRGRETLDAIVVAAAVTVGGAVRTDDLSDLRPPAPLPESCRSVTRETRRLQDRMPA
jgi:hypothetical protein